MTLDDATLLRRYAETRDEAAFAELVRRHVNPVYGVALRRLNGRTHAAEEVTQRVFTDLARKAAALTGRPMIAGWLYVSARHATAEYMRNEQRRRVREQEAMAMNQIESGSPTVGVEEWRGVLDDVVTRLGDTDREAVLLRFWEQRSFAEVGAALRTTEEAARKRVDRALEKMRGQLARRGMASTGAVLSMALTAQGASAPAGLAAAVVSTALAQVSAGSGGALVGFLTMTKLQAGAVSALLLAAAVTGIVEVRANRELEHELAVLEKGGRHEQLQQEGAALDVELQAASTSNPEATELARVRARLEVLKARPEGVTDAGMQPLANQGRDTPEAAVTTLLWALNANDLQAKGAFFTFTDDTPEARVAFMELLSTPVRDRFETPERFVAEAFIGSGAQKNPVTKYQVVDVRRTNAVTAKVTTWIQTASGREYSNVVELRYTPTGWGAGEMTLGSEKFRESVFSRLDPLTGIRVKK